LTETPPCQLAEKTPMSIGRNTPYVNWQKHPLCQLAEKTPLSIGRNEFRDCKNPVSI